MFFSHDKELNWEILTKNLVTFKRQNGVIDEKLWGFTEKYFSCTVCRFKRGLSEKDGVVFLREGGKRWQTNANYGQCCWWGSFCQQFKTSNWSSVAFAVADVAMNVTFCFSWYSWMILYFMVYYTQSFNSMVAEKFFVDNFSSDNVSI